MASVTPTAFPNMGVSLAFLKGLLDDPDMLKPMVSLARPDLTDAMIDGMTNQELRDLAKELRVHSDRDGNEEFALYMDEAIPRETWLAAVRQPPTTTTHVNLCIVKPRTNGLGGSYATTILAGEVDVATSQPLTGVPTDFASHAWRYQFKDFVAAIEEEARQRDAQRAREGLPPIDRKSVV